MDPHRLTDLVSRSTEVAKRASQTVERAGLAAERARKVVERVNRLLKQHATRAKCEEAHDGHERYENVASATASVTSRVANQSGVVEQWR